MQSAVGCSPEACRMGGARRTVSSEPEAFRQVRLTPVRYSRLEGFIQGLRRHVQTRFDRNRRIGVGN